MRVTRLREKDKVILSLITESYLKEGKPISSGFIAQRSPLPVSPATVRNIMTKLEEQGYLFQPHTSAGRIPTDKGLRLYVNNLLEETLLPEKKVELPEDFSLELSDFNSLLDQVSKVLAEQSDNLGFVLSPRISKINFRHIRFIKISEYKVMIILITTSKFVLNEIFQLNTYFTQLELDRASQYINQNFSGQNMFIIRDYLLKELPKFKIRYE
ncbi:MAG: heat-inducible transcription repressor HrcA, partial [Candidatus Aminicenantes bacterium]|nr:heat-inducible transcription repressor HrcA [Candidatus Aminicenantes bacterium]